MAFKKTYKKAVKKTAKKKYSLKERLNYHNSKVKFTTDYSKPFTKREEYSNGYEQAVLRGSPGDFDRKSKSYQNGVLAGLRAKEKSLNVKF